MGKNRKQTIQCNYCKKYIEKAVAQVNLSNKLGRPMYCGHECSNRARKQIVSKECKQCGNTFELKYRGKIRAHKRLFCSYRCGGLFASARRYEKFIKRWLAGQLIPKCSHVPGYIRRYLFKKYDNKCSECGWSRINPKTGKTPLEVEHIDGDWRNHRKENLRLLCPNCHSLTPTYRALNKGKGRKRINEAANAVETAD